MPSQPLSANPPGEQAREFPATIKRELFDLSVRAGITDWPGDRLLAVKREPGKFHVVLNGGHAVMLAWRRPGGKRSRSRALAQLLKLMVRDLRTSGAHPFEQLAIKSALESYLRCTFG